MTSWWTVTLGTVLLIGSYAVVAVTHIAWAIWYLLCLATWPVTALYDLALVVFAPAIYTIQFALAPLYLLAGALPRLEVLYIFFGCAAFVGILTGLTMQLTSSVFTSLLGMQGSDDRRDDKIFKVDRGDRQDGYDSLRGSEDEPSTPDSDSFWGDMGGSLTVPSLSKRKVPGRLFRETIHEEEDDDDSI